MAERYIFSDDPVTGTKEKRRALAEHYNLQEADVMRCLICAAYDNMTNGQDDVVNIPVVGKIENDRILLTSGKSGPAFVSKEPDYVGADTKLE